MIFDPVFDLDGLAETLIKTLEKLSALLLSDRLDEATEAGDFNVPLLKQFLHFLDMQTLVQLGILISNLNLGLILDELEVMCLCLRLCFD